MKTHKAFGELRKYVMTGKSISSKLKIFEICSLRYLQVRSPAFAKRFVDRLVKGMMIETDVKFFIRTLNDFFIFSVLWENELQEKLVFKNGANFLDVGAHIGKYTLRAALKVGKNGRVIAIEPNRDTYKVLLRNVELNDVTNCTPLNIAAYQTDSELRLFFGETSAQSSVVEASRKCLLER